MQEQHHILMYHHVAPFKGKEGLLPYVVSPEIFRLQLDFIQKCGLQVLTLAELIHRCDRSQLVARCVVMTFDDCAKELWDFAIPELEKRKLKATFFAVASHLGGENDWDDHRGSNRVPLMTAHELKNLADLGHEVGSHALHHRRLIECTDEEVLDELTRSRHEIGRVTGKEVKTLAYPFGVIPHGHADACRLAGYEAACSIQSASPTVLRDRFAIRRTIVHEGDVGWRLRFKLTGVFLKMRAIQDSMAIRRQAKAEGQPQ